MYWVWTFIILSVTYSRGTGACPDKCSCETASSCDGTYVDCIAKGLTTVPTNIPKDTCALHLYNNQLTTIGNGAFEGLSNLQTLYLFSNQLTTIGNGAFEGLSNLQTLILGYNQLTTIENGAFEGLSNLQELNLGYNQLTTIENGAFEGLSNLQTLFLDNNQLTTIENGAFEGLSNLQTLPIDRNPLHCDCQLVPFLSFAKSRSLELGLVGEPTCHTPANLRGTQIKNLRLPQMSRNCSLDSTTITATRETPDTGVISTTVMVPGRWSTCTECTCIVKL
ncbi:slit homolog 2 protein-like isoform X2 [Ostrea edulis]|uniref:slit homolog 2 protein-like isoform X2 n=1 Tax=Ostrea edulis TaxID=37623 RepID=UPI0024AEF009|nr:slit homolog 2 protein-like isoform X2 [Ostrea edulis]